MGLSQFKEVKMFKVKKKNDSSATKSEKNNRVLARLISHETLKQVSGAARTECIGTQKQDRVQVDCIYYPD